MEAALTHVLASPPTQRDLPDPEAWWARHREATAPFALPREQALVGGFSADRPAWAFASGYQCALRALVPSLPPTHRAALCATEEGGARPGALETAILETDQGLALQGRKRFVTLGAHADTLLVVASEGRDAQGRNRLRVARLSPDAPGVSLAPLPPLPFAPELPHAELSLERAPVPREDLLEGDGYTRYLKPFRTTEDLHVLLALGGWLLGVGRRAGWPREALGELAAWVLGWGEGTTLPPASPALHVALAGSFQQLRRWLEEQRPLWARVDDLTRARWERDQGLLNVADRARALRAEAAWKALSPG